MNIHYDDKVAKKKDSHFQEQISNEYFRRFKLLATGRTNLLTGIMILLGFFIIGIMTVREYTGLITIIPFLTGAGFAAYPICSGVILTIGIKKDIKMEEAEDN